MNSLEIEDLIILKFHLESEIKLIQNESIFQLAQNNLSNIFFNRYLSHYSKLKEYCKAKQELLNDIENYISQNCIHDWEEDYIDIDPEKSIKIKYCRLCSQTKN